MLKPTAGDTLRHARFKKGLTIDQVAAETGLAVSTIVAFEKGHRKNPHGAKVYRYAEFLGLDAESLFETSAEATA